MKKWLKDNHLEIGPASGPPLPPPAHVFMSPGPPTLTHHELSARSTGGAVGRRGGGELLTGGAVSSGRTDDLSSFKAAMNGVGMLGGGGGGEASTSSGSGSATKLPDRLRPPMITTNALEEGDGSAPAPMGPQTSTYLMELLQSTFSSPVGIRYLGNVGAGEAEEGRGGSATTIDPFSPMGTRFESMLGSMLDAGEEEPKPAKEEDTSAARVSRSTQKRQRTQAYVFRHLARSLCVMGMVQRDVSARRRRRSRGQCAQAEASRDRRLVVQSSGGGSAPGNSLAVSGAVDRLRADDGGQSRSLSATQTASPGRELQRHCRTLFTRSPTRTTALFPRPQLSRPMVRTLPLTDCLSLIGDVVCSAVLRQLVEKFQRTSLTPRGTASQCLGCRSLCVCDRPHVVDNAQRECPRRRRWSGKQ